jgi:N-methylhydantoinase B
MTDDSHLDPVLLEILKNALFSTCEEMGAAMQHTAYSPISSEARDFTVALLDAHAQLVGQFSFQPAQLGAVSLTVSTALAILGEGNIEPGDMVMLNDVCLGGTHIPEVTVFRPIFLDGGMVAIAANMAHLVDIGGTAPGGFATCATETFQEGIRVPPVKIWQRDRPVEDVVKVFLNNVRVPRDIEGDLNAMAASLLAGSAGCWPWSGAMARPLSGPSLPGSKTTPKGGSEKAFGAFPTANTTGRMPWMMMASTPNR